LKKSFTNEQTAFALREAETGVPVQEACRKIGVTDVTCHRWKERFTGVCVAEVRRLRQLEEEEKWKLKRLVVDHSLDKETLQDAIRNNSDFC
jgi:putative transposase